MGLLQQETPNLPDKKRGEIKTKRTKGAAAQEPAQKPHLPRQRHSRVPTCPPFFGIWRSYLLSEDQKLPSMPTDCLRPSGRFIFFFGPRHQIHSSFSCEPKATIPPDIISFFLRSKACAWNFNRACCDMSRSTGLIPGNFMDTPQVWCFIASCYIMLYQFRSQS